MMSTEVLDRAVMQDCLATIYQAFHDCNYYIKNATSVTTAWSGIQNEDRSLPMATYAKQAMVQSFRKLQEWAAPSLRMSGWLTRGIEGPGLVDVAIAPGVRYMELSYSFFIFEDETLQPLREWYVRFRSLQWWDEYEERGRHTKELSHPPPCREV